VSKNNVAAVRMLLECVPDQSRLCLVNTVSSVSFPLQ
jgi:hypothetical protein